MRGDIADLASRARAVLADSVAVVLDSVIRAETCLTSESVSVDVRGDSLDRARRLRPEPPSDSGSDGETVGGCTSRPAAVEGLFSVVVDSARVDFVGGSFWRFASGWTFLIIRLLPWLKGRARRLSGLTSTTLAGPTPACGWSGT